VAAQKRRAGVLSVVEAPLSTSIEMSVRFVGQGDARRPAALTRRQPLWGVRVNVRVEASLLRARAVQLLHRIGTDIVLMASANAEQAELARLAFGKSSAAYQVVEVALLDEAACAFDQDLPRTRGARWAQRSERLAVADPRVRNRSALR